jgi:hypothetical protein
VAILLSFFQASSRGRIRASSVRTAITDLVLDQLAGFERG